MVTKIYLILAFYLILFIILDTTSDWIVSSESVSMSMSQFQIQPNVIVAQDGSGNYKTITEAINSYPTNYQKRYIIYIKAGIYKEYIIVDKKKTKIFLYGDGQGKTIITGRKNAQEGLATSQTPTFGK